MKEWGIVIAAALVVAYIIHAIYQVGSVLGKSLDELHEKVDALQEKLEEDE
jgi:trans-2-enoyl-CoA reductase